MYDITSVDTQEIIDELRSRHIISRIGIDQIRQLYSIHERLVSYPDAEKINQNELHNFLFGCAINITSLKSFTTGEFYNKLKESFKN